MWPSASSLDSASGILMRGLPGVPWPSARRAGAVIEPAGPHAVALGLVGARAVIDAPDHLARGPRLVGARAVIDAPGHGRRGPRRRRSGALEVDVVGVAHWSVPPSVAPVGPGWCDTIVAQIGGPFRHGAAHMVRAGPHATNGGRFFPAHHQDAALFQSRPSPGRKDGCTSVHGGDAAATDRAVAVP